MYVDTAAAVRDPLGRPLGVVVLRTDAQKLLLPMLQTWPTPSPTAETVLVRRDGDEVVFLNELRYRKDKQQQVTQFKGLYESLRENDQLLREAELAVRASPGSRAQPPGRGPALSTPAKALGEFDVLAADDAHRDPRTSAFAPGYLTAMGITSMMDAVIRLGGGVVGVLCCEHTGRVRRWTHDEQTFAVAVANLVAMSLTGGEDGLARPRDAYSR